MTTLSRSKSNRSGADALNPPHVSNQVAKRRNKKMRKKTYLFLALVSMTLIYIFVAAKRSAEEMKIQRAGWQKAAEIACTKKKGIFKDRCIADISSNGDTALAKNPAYNLAAAQGGENNSMKRLRSENSSKNVKTKRSPAKIHDNANDEMKRTPPKKEIKKHDNKKKNRVEHNVKNSGESGIKQSDPSQKDEDDGDKIPPEIFADEAKRLKAAQDACKDIKGLNKKFCTDDVFQTGFLSLVEMYE